MAVLLFTFFSIIFFYFTFFFFLYFKYFLRHLSLYYLWKLLIAKALNFAFMQCRYSSCSSSSSSIFYMMLLLLLLLLLFILFYYSYSIFFFLKEYVYRRTCFKNRLISVRVLLQLSSAVIEKKLYNTYVYT